MANNDNKGQSENDRVRTTQRMLADEYKNM